MGGELVGNLILCVWFVFISVRESEGWKSDKTNNNKNEYAVELGMGQWASETQRWGFMRFGPIKMLNDVILAPTTL